MKNIGLSRFRRKAKVVVLGDVMLDRYFWGTVDRISQEAPVPIVDVNEVRHTLGGAANVMSNSRGLLAEVWAFGVVGNDPEGSIIRSELAGKGVYTQNLLTDNSRPTTVKCRVMSGHYQISRYDIEKREEINNDIQDELIEGLEKLSSDIDIIIISDYDKGVLTRGLIDRIIEISKKEAVPILVDPKVRNTRYFRSIDYLKINLHNAERVTGIPYFEDEDIETICHALASDLKCDNIIVTRGKDGLTYISHGKINNIKTMAKEVFDVTGAGDVMTSALGIALANGYDLESSCYIGTLASAIKVSKVGTYSVSISELEEAVKLYGRELTHEGT